jgi:hypothetical protein
MGGNHGGHTALKRERRAVLTTRRSEIVSSLAAAGIDPNSDEGRAAQVWGNALLRSREAWAEEHRHGRRYSDKEVNGPLIRPASSHFGGRNNGY